MCETFAKICEAYTVLVPMNTIINETEPKYVCWRTFVLKMNYANLDWENTYRIKKLSINKAIDIAKFCPLGH